MALSSSPTSIGSYEDDVLYHSSHFTKDISEQMRVPKRIKGTGEYYEDQDMWAPNHGQANGNSNAWNYQDNFDMTVPDRIVVIGQEQHHVLGSGTRSAPREILLENSIMKSPDRESVRVSTPPRSIVLSHHHFPSASDDPEVSSQTDTLNAEEEEEDIERTGVARAIDAVRRQDNKDYFRTVERFHSRGSTPPLNQSLMETMTPSEELLHLRKSIQHMRARVITVELELAQLAQREKYFIFGGMGYLLLKFIWYLRSK